MFCILGNRSQPEIYVNDMKVQVRHEIMTEVKLFIGGV